jgi:hypothetical protein
VADYDADSAVAAVARSWPDASAVAAFGWVHRKAGVSGGGVPNER